MKSYKYILNFNGNFKIFNLISSEVLTIFTITFTVCIIITI